MTRRCFHCSHDGHNSRTCPNRGVKLFGVRLTDGSIRKSASMGNLSLLAGSSGGASPADGPEPGGGGASADGYASEDFVKGSSASCRERKKGNPWTEEEHRRFLLGLQKLGKGDWRGISRNYVVSRTPTQVASHAQKYFIRKANMTRRKRRSSLFDMEPDEPLEPQPFLMSFQESDAQNNKPPPIPPTLNEEYESMDSNDSIIEAVVSQPEASQCSYPVILPAYFSPFLQYSFPNWSGNRSDTSEQQAHVIIKPTPVHSKTAINVDELVGMSKLSIGESAGEKSSTLDLLGGSKRQSAFHANPSTRAHT
ncbi:transcription factor MYBS3-like [Musa acuminata AAA Group]|uniref:transcription factor MYBS3 n=1 Tax=Musa acuminata AAA Group TaxID=214697 RepID=UPI0031D788E5